MEVIPFLATSAADAISQIRQQLGPQAIVVNVRKRPPTGLARLWQRSKIEVLATVPESPSAPATTPPSEAAVAILKAEIEQLKQLYPQGITSEPTTEALPELTEGAVADQPRNKDASYGEAVVFVPPTMAMLGKRWRLGDLLRNLGLQPTFAQQVVDRISSEYGFAPPATVAEELALARAALAKMWRPQKSTWEPQLHVFIGPPGVGKTTFLCKWLTKAVLLEGQQVRVWRVDGRTANAAELLSLHCEILGVPVERFWSGAEFAEQVGFIDLPGTMHHDANAVREIRLILTGLPAPQVHLVLNAAYESTLLLEQVKAFDVLPIHDMILTHLDEEPHWGKVWNLVLGTNYPIRALSMGQNIPGDWLDASAETLLSRLFPPREPRPGG